MKEITALLNSDEPQVNDSVLQTRSSFYWPSEKTSSSAIEADRRLYTGPSGSRSSRVGHCRLLLIQALRLTMEDGLSIVSVHRQMGNMVMKLQTEPQTELLL